MFMTNRGAAREDPPGVPASRAANPPERDQRREPPLLTEERRLLRLLSGLIERKTREEPVLIAGHQKALEELQERFDTDYQDIIIRFARKKESLEEEVAKTRAQLKSAYERKLSETETAFAAGRDTILSAYVREKEALKNDYREGRWTATAVCEGMQTQAEKTLKMTIGELDTAQGHLAEWRGRILDFLTRSQMPVPETRAPLASDSEASSLEELRQRLQSVKEKGRDLENMKLPGFFRREGVLWLFLLLWLVLAYPAIYLSNYIAGLVGSAAAALALAFLSARILYRVTAGRVETVSVPLLHDLVRAENLEQRERQAADIHYRNVLRESREKLNLEMRRLVGEYRSRKAAAQENRANSWRLLVRETQHRRHAAKRQRDRRWRRNETNAREEKVQNQKSYEDDSRRVRAEFDQGQSTLENEFERVREGIQRDWDEGIRQIVEGSRDIEAQAREWSPPWDAGFWQSTVVLSQMPQALVLGRLQRPLEQLPGALPKGITATGISLPALVPFPPAGSLVVQAPRAVDGQALGILQNVILRWLTSVPGGKVRFTFIDPLGLGQNFACFMHLADFDELLVTSRIWTEPVQIEQRLADMMAHMEQVIQKYLRNQYASIDEYNTKAGEVAEPYRVLVISHFPTNFSVEAQRRLASIVSSGPRCGVFTLIYIDASQPMPTGLSIADLERNGLILSWNKDRFVWQDEDFHDLRFEPSPVPAETKLLPLLEEIGRTAQANKRVQVPFAFVAPQADAWWGTTSAAGLEVPIGRSGATRRQFLRLGQGTSQHALVAGKTGSGKSTLLHALITNLALLYSPQEVELYLIDFKKGVEFKTYASHHLPHARVVAIESEREFGLSVLERLLHEMDRRAELFRAAGVQDLKSYRQARPEQPLPRIVLIVDEFQEFFVEEDMLADRAAGHLDRLVRQGRAFGIHAVLGSQTLGGAYTLARSTIDQMGVRIALQCSEADGHLILSEENHAARLLTRPGEAIYNDANGLVEGNNPFQVVWLEEEDREQHLDRLVELAGKRGHRDGQPMLVFEGSAVADIESNRFLEAWIRGEMNAPDRRGLAVWLGDSIAIKDPTAAYFKPQSGGNMLLLGQNEEAAKGLLVAALVSLHAQGIGLAQPETAPRFYFLEGLHTAEDPSSTGALARAAALLECPAINLGKSNLAAELRGLAGEVQRRQEASDNHVPTFLFIHGLQRYRDLRRAEDDFSFSRTQAEGPTSAQDLNVILRDGAAVGVYILAWCDTLANLGRQLERAAIKEFEVRVLFQMSAADSSVVIDSPKASRLGLYRALLVHEAEDVDEKFRPYGVPSSAWLEEAGRRMRHSCNGRAVPQGKQN